jgi:membrane-associated phospholipid phosphatase
MKNALRFFLILFCFAGTFAFAQQDTLIHKLDSLSRKKDSAEMQLNNIKASVYNETTKITFRNYFALGFSDLKQELTKPFHMTGKDWRNLAKFAVIIGAAGFADEPVQKFAVHLTNNNPGLLHISQNVTYFGARYEMLTLATIAAYGFIFKKPKMITTTLLATQAYLIGSAIENTLKFFTGRTRPTYYAPGVEPEPKFMGPGFLWHAHVNGGYQRSSFPSGHTTVAFAAATVFASEYRNTTAIPIIAYSAATLIGLSRITQNAHWLTDVIAGAANGFLAGKNIVNNYHRYAKIKDPHHNKNTLSFNLQYNIGHASPGFIYKFR